MPTPRQIWLIATLKGGTRKTTTAMELAFALAVLGIDVLVIDADYGSQGVTDWGSKVYAAGGELPFDVAQWSPGMGLLVPFIQKQAKNTNAVIVLVDIGGEAPETLKNVTMIANRVISPVGPEEAEISRLPATRSLIPAGIPMEVLLTRVPVPGRGAAAQARADITAAGFTVLRTEIEHNRARYADAWGTIPENLGAYTALANELTSGKAA